MCLGFKDQVAFSLLQNPDRIVKQKKAKTHFKFRDLHWILSKENSSNSLMIDFVEKDSSTENEVKVKFCDFVKTWLSSIRTALLSAA